MNQGKEISLHQLTEAQRFQLLVTSVSDYAIYLLDADGYINSWNAGAHRFKGYSAQEIIGKHFSVFYTPEDNAAGIPVRALEIAAAEGKFEAEGWRVRKDGSRFWASVVIDPIRNELGKLIGYAKVTRDITERMQTQQALRASEERFRLLVQGVTDYALYMLSPEGLVTNWNVGAERIKGYTDDEIVGTHFSKFYSEEDQEAGAPARSLAVAMAEGRYEQEGWRVRKDGTRFRAHVVIDTIHDDAGKLVGFAKITRDVTEQKRIEEALAKANQALFQSQKMEAIGQLTGGIAHDFNNLLAVMSSSLEVLLMKQVGSAEGRIFDAMKRAVSRGAILTQQLLSFARQQPLDIRNLNVNTVIEGFEAVIRRAVNSLISFHIDLQPDIGFVSLDAARFESAVLNLVVNARDAMSEGGVIHLSTRQVELEENEPGIANLAAGRHIRISISDTGTGMPPAVAARAFEPFFTTKDVGKGTGLGLSQVYGFIEQSGGKIVLASELGKGTSFHIYLPVVSRVAADEQPARVSENNSEIVLIVEDEPDLLELAAQLFRSLGYETLTAGNAGDGIDILNRRQDVKLLFADVMLPNGMNGIELAQAARKLYPNLRVILASGFALPALRKQYGSLDEFSFLNKPYRLAELAKKLRA
ncbi:MAG TPA: PAS domain S-box protein [Methylobacter sp.]|jgi:PAS domain S-box-containing protein